MEENNISRRENKMILKKIILIQTISFFFNLIFFPCEYEGVYWSFLGVSWRLDCLCCWILWSEAQKLGLINVWLECDSALVCVVFTARTNVPWMLRNWWNSCLNYCGKIRFRVTYIFRGGNACADKLANLGFIHRESFYWYNRLSSSLFLEFFINMYSLLCIVFVNI